MKGLKDIKGIIEVQDNSLIILLGLVLLALTVIGFGVYFFKNRRRRKKKATPQEVALQKLHVLDYNNSKEVVYTFEEQARLFLNEKNENFFSLQPFFYLFSQLISLPAYSDSVITKLCAEDFFNRKNCQKRFNIDFAEDMLKSPSYSLSGYAECFMDFLAISTL